MNKSTPTFQKILKQEKDKVFSYAYYLIRNKEDAEDIVQDVFIKLWKNWDSIQSDKRMGWIMRVTHNTCIDWTRRKKSVSSRRHITSRYELDHMASDMSDAHETLLLNDTQDKLLSAMTSLDEPVREMLLLHYFWGLKYEDIGTIMEMSGNGVKVAVHRGRQKLKNIMMEHYPEVME